MNFVVFILFLIIAVLAYILYFYFYNPSKPSSDLRSLSESISIPPGEISMATADTVYYELWLYFNAESTSKQIIFSHEKFALTIDGQKLAVESLENVGGKEQLTVMQNVYDHFPIQKWAYVVIARQGDILESYLNGKLVKTNQYSSTMKTKLDCDATKSIIIGNTKLNGYITKFNRKPSTIGADDVWKKYMKGNGVPSATSTMKGYETGLEITRNKEDYGYYKIF
jgi:hypothetical protein